MEEFFEEAKKGSVEIIESIEKIVEQQFDSLSNNQFFEGKNELEKNLTQIYKNFRKSILDYKISIEKYWDSKKEEFSPFNLLKKNYKK